MRIDTLREFLYLAESLNFSETARHFFIAQPSLSRHIIDLEKKLGCDLFLRNKQSVRLTTTGKLLADRARELVNAHDDIIKEIKREQISHNSMLSIGYLHGASSNLLDGCYRLFKREYPDTAIFSRSLQPNVILDELKSDKIDIGITMCPKNAEMSLFEITPLYSDEFTLMVERSNEISKKCEISTDELKDAIGIPEGFPHEEKLGAFLRETLQRSNIPFIDLPYIDDIDSMPLLFQNHSAIIMSCAHLSDYFGPRFKMLTFKDLELKYDICLLWKKSRQKKQFDVFAECLRYSYDIHRASVGTVGNT